MSTGEVRPTRLRIVRGCSALLIWLAQGLFAFSAFAQNAAPEPDAAAVEPTPAQATARELERRFRRSRDLLAEQNYFEATRLLQSVLDSDEDKFFRPGAGESQSEKSLKFEAQRLLGELPAAGRETYEKQYGPAARRLLAEAVSEHDVDQLALVTRRYFHTQAGYEAAYRLAADHLDHARPLSAALAFEQLRQSPRGGEQFEPLLSLKAALAWQQSGLVEQARPAVERFLDRARRSSVVLGGQEIRSGETVDEAWVWLAKLAGAPPRVAGPEHWPMFRGDARRNAASSGGSPYLNRFWHASTLEGIAPTNTQEATLARAFQERRPVGPANPEENVAPALVTLQPLVVDNLVIVRSIGDVRAYDLSTGRLVWAAGEKDQTLVDSLRSPASAQPSNPLLTSLDSLVTQRVLADATFGQISTDGELVFAIEDLPATSALPFPQPRAPPVRDFNRMVAIDVKTGRAVWEAGGPRGSPGDLLSGLFFLAAPLVLDRRLYCLADAGSEVRLVVLEPQTGELEWSQALSDDPGLGYDLLRRQSALSPSYDGGVLVCPVGSDDVVAVDLARRFLLWRYRLRIPGEVIDPRRQQMLIIQQQQLAARGQGVLVDQNRWLDTGCLISQARVVLTPRETGEIHCLNLIDGTLAWKKPRNEGLFAACIHHQSVVLVGKSYVQALSLENGEAAWPEPTRISVPSGRGFVSGDFYHLPLTTAEVATIDLRDGRVVSRARSPAGRALGNLVGVRGSVVSQGSDFLETYRQLDALEAEISQALAADPTDARSLALRGEIRLQRGQVREAYGDLKRALELKSDDTATRDLLLGSLLEGLRVDFASYRDLRDDIEKLLADPVQRSTYLWLQSTGLVRAGETLPAFEMLLRFAEPGVSDREMERVDGSLTVRRDRLVRSRVAQLMASADDAQRQRMHEVLGERAAHLVEATDAAAAARLVDYFARYLKNPGAVRLAIEADQEEWLSREFRLADAASAAPDLLRGALVARQAELLLAAERFGEVAPLLDALERHWPEVECLDGKSGAQLAREWRDLPEVLPRALAEHAWPAGHVDVERVERAGNTVGISEFAIPVAGDRGAWYRDASFVVSARWQDFVARDGFGQPLWKVSLDSPVQTANILFNRAWVREHFVLFSIGTQVVAVDPLGSKSAPGPRVLWRMNLTDFPSGGIVQRGARGPGRRLPIQQLGDQVASIGPVTRDYVVLLRGRKLLVVEPLTGKPLWIREGVAPGSELFGDEELLFALAPDGNQAYVNRVLDGEFAGTRVVPGASARLDAWGRRLVSWQKNDGGQVLAVRDVWADEELWTREFEDGSTVAVIDPEEIAVLEPNGAFSVLALADGKVRLAAQTEPHQLVQQLHVIRSRESYVLVANEPVPQSNSQFTQVPPLSILVNGRIYCFDRETGKTLWSKRLERHGLDPWQPAELPVLTFLAQTAERRRGAAGFEGHFTLLCLDRRTGRVIHEIRRTDEPMFFVEYGVDRGQNQIELRLARSLLRLTFTDKPISE